MTSMELLEALGQMGDGYIAEAHPVPKRRLSRKLPLLLAAALAALLAGCAVVYALSTANLKVGTRGYSEPVYDESMALQGYATGTREVLTLSGLKGTASYQAAKDWFAFLESYDPEREIYNAQKAAGKLRSYPKEYAVFSPYSQEMVDKIDEIAEKYGLSLPGAKLSTVSEKVALRAMGVDSVLTPAATEDSKLLDGSFYENGNFSIGFFVYLSQEDWPYATSCHLNYTRHDSFSPWFAELDDGSTWREWDYTTAEGTEILILRSDDSSHAWLFRDTADGFLAAMVRVTLDIYDDQAGDSHVVMTDSQLESVADKINFAMTPTPVAAGTDLNDTGIDTSAQVQTVGGYTMELCSADTDGQTAYIILGLTGPEGTTLLDSEAGITTHVANITLDGAKSWACSVRADGSENTGKIILTATGDFTGSGPWTLYLEDLEVFQAGNETGERVAGLEGAWQFTLDFSGCDTRAVELLAQPISFSAAVGMALDGSDVYETVTMTSFLLRAYGAETLFDGAGGELSTPDHPVQVVLKDGTQIPIRNTSGGSGRYFLRVDDMSTPIPLDQVEKVILPDGQTLTMPD